MTGVSISASSERISIPNQTTLLTHSSRPTCSLRIANSGLKKSQTTNKRTEVTKTYQTAHFLCLDQTPCNSSYAVDDVWRNFVHNFVHNFVRLKWQIVKLRSRSRLGIGQVRVRRVRFGHELYNIFNTAHQVLMFGCVSPNLKIQLTECSRMFQNVPECMQNVQECYRMYVECFRMLQNIPECMKNVQE